MITFTKEQLIASAHARIEFAEMMLSGELEPLKERTWSIELELARIALASLEAEPVAWLLSGGGAKNHVSFDSGNAYADPLREVTPLYTAQPAPVAPDEMTPQQASRSYGGEVRGYRDGWNACRAAMLQGADGTLTNEGTIPVTQFKPVADLYGLTSPTGGETSFTFDAVEARDFIDGGWSCQEYVELGRYQEALTDHSEGDLDMVRPVMFIDGNLLPGDAEKLKAAIEEFNHSGEPTIMIAGNSPVIPDGWVLVPIEPTEDMIVNGFESEPDESFSDEKEWEAYDAMSGCQQAAHRAKLCWEAMISAAPKPTVR